jgi:hypothetical protein
MSAKAAGNRRVLWVLIGIWAALFAGSILFIISRAAH